MVDQVAGELQRLHVAAGEPPDDALVFADPYTEGPLDKAAILKRFRAALKAAKLDETHRFHDLRHTFGTQIRTTTTCRARAVPSARSPTSRSPPA